MSSDIENRIRQSFPQLAVQMDSMPATLSPRWLMDAARQGIGATDFGPNSFTEPLALLCASADTDANLNAYGRMLLAGMIRIQLENRLLMQQVRKAGRIGPRPTPPIIVTGLPRTGTTFLHRLLASDPGHSALPYWQLVRPFPRNAQDTPDVRLKDVKAMLDVRRAITPELDGVHLIRADSPEECMFMTAMSMQSRLYWNLAPVYSFMEWYNQADRTDKYREYAEMLSYLQQSYPGQRFVLKAPDHVDGLSELLDVFPEAIIVQTHRDMVAQFGSYMSLGRVTRKLAVNALDDAREVGAVLSLTDSSINRNNDARLRHPGRILDIRYQDLTADPLKCVEQIYAHAGMKLEDEQRVILQGHLQRNTKDKHGAHCYDLADFGVTETQIKSRYARYESQFVN